MSVSSSCAGRDPAKPLQRRAKMQQSCDALACRYCGIYKLCLPLGLERADSTLLDSIVRRRAVFKRAQLLFRPGQRNSSELSLPGLDPPELESRTCRGKGLIQIKGSSRSCC